MLRDGIYRTAVHGKNWTRLYPPVADENIERIELERVIWAYKDGVYFPTTGTNIEFSELVDSSPMKMILEIPKDKP